MKTRNAIILIALIALVILSRTGVLSPKGHAPAGQPAMVELDAQKLESLREDFNAASSQTRIVLLVAPT
jgi:hypothetical protein